MKKLIHLLFILFITPFLLGAGVFYEIEEPVLGPATVSKPIKICSFNIQFLGHFKKKDDKALASILKDYDIVVIQELVAPPTDGTYPDNETYSADPESKEFFDEMTALGFEYQLSEEDTGTNDQIHKNTTETEWWVAFYKPAIIDSVNDIPNGFLADDRSNHPDYERVPYAFAFRTDNRNMDFVLISVHLQPGESSSDRARRKHELSSIGTWIDKHDDIEKDFIILGDMNIYNSEELSSVTPTGFISLNDECRSTNTNINSAAPYDHVMFNPSATSEVDQQFDLEVINLISKMKPLWTGTGVYPGEPYDHNQFKQYYSDHCPVIFQMMGSGRGDD